MTSLKRWDPFQDFLNKFFEEEIYPFSSKSSFGVDVYEEGNNVIVEMDVPGFKKEDIKISLVDDYLKIVGKMEQSKEEKKKNYWRKERRSDSFIKVISLPTEVNVDQAKASLENGLLRIIFPKLNETKTEGREIKID